MINLMEKEEKNIKVIKLISLTMKDNFNTEKDVEKVLLLGKINLPIMEILIII